MQAATDFRVGISSRRPPSRPQSWGNVRTSGRLFDAVLVDEGQDLNPSHWQFLRVLVAPGPNDLFIAEDSHQRIYGQRIVLSRYGIKITGRSPAAHVQLPHDGTEPELRRRCVVRSRLCRS